MRKIKSKIDFLVIDIPKNINPKISIYGEDTKVEQYRVVYDDILINIGCKGEIIGKLSELTEVDFERFVNWMFWDEKLERKRFQNYYNPIAVTYPFLSAKESFVSLLKANDYWLSKWIDISKISKKAECDESLQTIDWWRNKYKCAIDGDFLIVKIIE